MITQGGEPRKLPFSGKFLAHTLAKRVEGVFHRTFGALGWDRRNKYGLWKWKR